MVDRPSATKCRVKQDTPRFSGSLSGGSRHEEPTLTVDPIGTPTEAPENGPFDGEESEDPAGWRTSPRSRSTQSSRLVLPGSLSLEPPDGPWLMQQNPHASSCHADDQRLCPRNASNDRWLLEPFLNRQCLFKLPALRLFRV